MLCSATIIDQKITLQLPRIPKQCFKDELVLPLQEFISSPLISSLGKTLLLGSSYDQPRQHIKKQMWELDCKERWAPKNWCFLTVVLEKILESPLDCKEIQPVHPKGDQSWVFIGRSGAEAETQYFCHLMRRVDSLAKTLILGGTGGRRRRVQQRIRWLNASLIQWTWVWVNSGSWWWTGRPGVLWFMGSQRVGQDWATELNWRII